MSTETGSLQVDQLRAARQVGNEVLEEGGELEYGALGAAARGLGNGGRGRYGNLGGLGTGSSYQPGMTVLVQWTPQFAMAYQQFMGGAMGGFPMARMGGMNGYPMGGMGGMGGFGGGMQSVPYGFN